MKLKRIAAALGAAALSVLAGFSLCGCTDDSTGQPAAALPTITANVDVLQFREPAADALVAVFTTSQGEFSAVLYPEAAPQAVQNFVTLARQGAYDGLDFHRILEDFIIQTGDTDGNGGQSIWGTGFAAECSDLVHHYTGALSMAGIQANHSQFFVVNCPQDSVVQTLSDQMRTDGWNEDVIAAYTQVGGAPYLDNIHTVFGQVFYGMDTVRAIGDTAVQENAGVPTLDSVRITTYAAWQTAHPDNVPVFYDPTAADTAG